MTLLFTEFRDNLMKHLSGANIPTWIKWKSCGRGHELPCGTTIIASSETSMAAYPAPGGFVL